MNHNERLRGILTKHNLVFIEGAGEFCIVSRSGLSAPRYDVYGQGVTIEEAIARYDATYGKTCAETTEPYWIYGDASINTQEAPVCSKCDEAVAPDAETMQQHENSCWRTK